MNKILSKIVSAVTAVAMALFVSSGSLQTFVDEIEVHATETDVILGEVNNDDRVDVFDLCLMKRELINPGTTTINKVALDVNADEIFDVKDIIEVQEFLLCKREHFSATTKATAKQIKALADSVDYTIVTPNEPIETSITAEIAKNIDNMDDPVDVYEYLYNNINTEFYFGSRKGAIGTYEQYGGNDIDQASLLIAVLRYLGYEADYTTALVELTPQQAMDISGTSDVDTAFDVFNMQARDSIKTIRASYDEANHISSITVEHTWVKAKLPSSVLYH